LLFRDVGREFHSWRTCARPAPATLAQERGRLGERPGRDNFYAVGQCRFCQATQRHDDATHLAPRQGHDHWQQAWHRAQVAPKRKLAEDGPPAIGNDLLGADEDPQGDGQIQRRSPLAQVGWRQIDRDPAGRVLIAAVTDRATNSFPGLLKSSVGQTDDGEAG
jgi:hypothetical protein